MLLAYKLFECSRPHTVSQRRFLFDLGHAAVGKEIHLWDFNHQLRETQGNFVDQIERSRMSQRPTGSCFFVSRQPSNAKTEIPTYRE